MRFYYQFSFVSGSQIHQNRVLEASREVLKVCWGCLGTSWGRLGTSWSVLEPSWSVLEPSWSRLGAVLKRMEAVCGALVRSEPPTTLRPEPPGRSTPLSRAKPLGPPGRARTSPPFTPFTPSTPRHATPRHASPRHASPRLAMTPRRAKSDRFGWILQSNLAFKIHQNREQIDTQRHSVLDCVF